MIRGRCQEAEMCSIRAIESREEQTEHSIASDAGDVSMKSGFVSRISSTTTPSVAPSVLDISRRSSQPYRDGSSESVKALAVVNQTSPPTPGYQAGNSYTSRSVKLFKSVRSDQDASLHSL